MSIVCKLLVTVRNTRPILRCARLRRVQLESSLCLVPWHAIRVHLLPHDPTNYKPQISFKRATLSLVRVYELQVELLPSIFPRVLQQFVPDRRSSITLFCGSFNLFSTCPCQPSSPATVPSNLYLAVAHPQRKSGGRIRRHFRRTQQLGLPVERRLTMAIYDLRMRVTGALGITMPSGSPSAA